MVKENLKSYKKSILVLLVLIIVLAIVIIKNNIVQPYLEYKEAVKLFDENKIEEAIMIFTDLGDYKDSIKYLEKVNDNIYEDAYRQYANGQFEYAEKLFHQIIGYKDTERYLKDISE